MPSSDSAWFLFVSGAHSAAANMALDQALLESMPRGQRPVLRFYAWSEFAASFGYFQKYSEVERATRLRPLVRRPTGGGIVPHDADWTYSLVFPAGHAWYSLTACESYRRVHEWICAAFNTLNIHAELAQSERRAGPGQCFAGHERFDVLWGGKKIAGAAQRRTRDGLLIQGSVQPSFNFPRTDWQAAMCEIGRREHGGLWVPFEPDAALLQEVERLANEKYSQSAYNRKR